MCNNVCVYIYGTSYMAQEILTDQDEHNIYGLL